MNAQQQRVVLGLGEMSVTADPSSVLVCLGLGSCLAISAYDPVSKVAGMAHLVIASSKGMNHSTASPAKYVDTGIPALFGEMSRQGASVSRLVIKLIGGAKMSAAPGLDDFFDIGEKNLAMARDILTAKSIPVAATETGGDRGRSVRMFVDTGTVMVSSIGGQSKEL